MGAPEPRRVATDASPALAHLAARSHRPVLRDRVIDLLGPSLQSDPAVYVDATLGMGGHAEAILDACPRATLIGIDRDTRALELAGARLARFGDRVLLDHAVFDELPAVLERAGVTRIQAALLDLGVSSLQIDDADRGFAYSVDAPLDMRMDPTRGQTAAALVNTLGAAELARIFRTLGEEPFASRIADRIVRTRATHPYERSGQLVDTIAEAIPASARHRRGHPAKRVFQALRIQVNGELDALQSILPEALAALSVGGRLAVLAYHSLEDRIVKQTFAHASTDRAPAGLPVVPAHLRARFALVTRGAERPDPAETETNPRAGSARLRVIERVEEDA